MYIHPRDMRGRAALGGAGGLCYCAVLGDKAEFACTGVLLNSITSALSFVVFMPLLIGTHMGGAFSLSALFADMTHRCSGGCCCPVCRASRCGGFIRKAARGVRPMTGAEERHGRHLPRHELLRPAGVPRPCPLPVFHHLLHHMANGAARQTRRKSQAPLTYAVRRVVFESDLVKK